MFFVFEVLIVWNILFFDVFVDYSIVFWIVLIFVCRLFLMFCIINMLNYVDRGVIVSNGVNGSLEICIESGICILGSGI